MSEWLDLMMDEVVRKQREARDARDEQARREKQKKKPAAGDAKAPKKSNYSK